MSEYVKMIPTVIDCPKHGRKEVISVRTSFRTITAMCPECMAEREREEEEERAAEMARAELERLERAGIRERYRECTLDNYDPRNESQDKALAMCRELIAGKIENLVLFGGNGVGKTHLSCGVIKQMGGSRHTVYELVCLLHECYSPKASRTELQLVKELGFLPLLVIDELGGTRGTPSEMAFLSAVIDERHSRRKPIMILTNLTRKEKCAMYNRSHAACATCEKQNCIERYLNNDALSRLSDGGAKVDIVGDDFRRKSGKTLDKR